MSVTIVRLKLLGILLLGTVLGCDMFVQSGEGAKSGGTGGKAGRGGRGGNVPDSVAVARGEKLCKDFQPVWDQMMQTRAERQATPLYQRYTELLPKLDAPETAGPDVLAKARALRDEYLKECMKRPDWTFDGCRQGDLARPLSERIVKVAIAQKNVALAYAENALLNGADESQPGAEFLGELHRHPIKRRLDPGCIIDKVWHLPDAGPRPERFNMNEDILKSANLDPLHDAGKVYAWGLVKSVGTGPLATVTFGELQRVGIYQSNCHSTGEVKRVNNIGGVEYKQACDQHTGVGTQAAAAPIKLTEGEAAGIKAGMILHAAVDPKTRVGYVIRALARADQLDATGSKLVKVRGIQF
jgi:hypothetical protein